MEIRNFLNALVALVSFIVCLNTALAAQDSVAVFSRPEKVIVLATEEARNGRLHNFMDSWELNDVDGGKNEIIWQSLDRSLTIRCFRDATKASCTFKLLAAGDVVIKNKSAYLQTRIPDATSKDFEFEFQSSRNNYFYFKSVNDFITIKAEKP